MKTTAKPAGPVEFEKSRRVVEEIFDPFRTICDFSDSEFPTEAEDQHGEFIADAFNVYHETGLSPRELLAQRDRLLQAALYVLGDIESSPSGKLGQFSRGEMRRTVTEITNSLAAIQNASKGGEKG